MANKEVRIMDFEELINFIIVVIFIGIALLVKLIGATSRKKIPPGPVQESPEEVWDELEIETEPEIKIKEPVVEEPIEIPSVPEKKPEIIIPREEVPAPSRFLSREDLQEGIILSAILGHPRSVSKWRPFRYQ